MKKETSDIISVNSYFLSMAIGTIPVLGDILLFKWFRDKDGVRHNKRNLCGAYLLLKFTILYPIILAICVVAALLIKG